MMVTAHHQVDGDRLISQQHREDAAQQSFAAENDSCPCRGGVLLRVGLGKKGKSCAEQCHIEDRRQPAAKSASAICGSSNTRV